MSAAKKRIAASNPRSKRRFIIKDATDDKESYNHGERWFRSFSRHAARSPNALVLQTTQPKASTATTLGSIVYIALEHKSSYDVWSRGTGSSTIRCLGAFDDFGKANRVAFNAYKSDTNYQYLLDASADGGEELDECENETGHYELDTKNMPDNDSREVHEWIVQKATVQ